MGRIIQGFETDKYLGAIGIFRDYKLSTLYITLPPCDLTKVSQSCWCSVDYAFIISKTVRWKAAVDSRTC